MKRFLIAQTGLSPFIQCSTVLHHHLALQHYAAFLLETDWLNLEPFHPSLPAGDKLQL